MLRSVETHRRIKLTTFTSDNSSPSLTGIEAHPPAASACDMSSALQGLQAAVGLEHVKDSRLPPRFACWLCFCYLESTLYQEIRLRRLRQCFNISGHKTLMHWQHPRLHTGAEMLL